MEIRNIDVNPVVNTSNLITLLKLYGASAELKGPKILTKDSPEVDKIMQVIKKMEEYQENFDAIDDMLNVFKDTDKKNTQIGELPKSKQLFVQSTNSDSSQMKIGVKDDSGPGMESIHTGTLTKKRSRTEISNCVKKVI